MKLQKAARVFRDEGWNSLLFKIKKKLVSYRLFSAQKNKKNHQQKMF